MKLTLPQITSSYQFPLEHILLGMRCRNSYAFLLGVLLSAQLRSFADSMRRCVTVGGGYYRAGGGGGLRE